MSRLTKNGIRRNSERIECHIEPLLEALVGPGDADAIPIGFGSLIMPSVALGAITMSTFARMTRISVLDELGRDYVNAGRARGRSRGAVVVRHVLRNAAIPVLTITAIEIGKLLAGAVIVETVFAWPGIGQLAIQSIQSRDFLVVQGVVLFVSLTYIAMNLAADLLYTAIDPRIRGSV